MLKIPLASYDWALRQLIKEGDTDLFPPQFEIGALKYLWSSLRKDFAGMDVSNYAWRGGRRFVVPKPLSLILCNWRASRVRGSSFRCSVAPR
jgi:hypothetical protein